MDALEILSRFDEIVDTDDKNVASEKIVSFKEYINETAGQDAATVADKDTKINELTEQVSKLTKENEEVRKHNTDILLKYGAMAEKIASNAIDYVEPTKLDTPKSWGDISKME